MSIKKKRLRGTKVNGYRKTRKGTWEGKRKDVIRQASSTDSCFATHIFSRSLHQFFAEEFK